MRKVAIFDIDGTIFRSSLMVEFIDALIQEGIFPASTRKIYAQEFERWLNRKDIYQKYIDKVAVAFMITIKGKDFRRCKKVIKQVVAFHKSRVYRYTRDLLRELKKKNYYLIAISHSYKEIVGEFCRELGFDQFYGRLFAIGKNGKFTGQTIDSDMIAHKDRMLKYLVKKFNLSLKGSIGVGDTEGDVPVLKLVDKPICFNPNKKLFTYARRHGWAIVVERKDVIYNF